MAQPCDNHHQLTVRPEQQQKKSQQGRKADPGAYTQTSGAESELNPVVAGRYRDCLKGFAPALQRRSSPVDRNLPAWPELLVQGETASGGGMHHELSYLG